MTKRQPAVAGYFYPQDKDVLIRTVDEYLKGTEKPRDATLAIMPHAGYVYSGHTAGAVAAVVNVPRRVIILGPKHRSQGDRAAVSSASAWLFPFGAVPVDEELSQIIAEGVPGMTREDRAHRDEHSIEVQVPFLWRRNPSLTITPIALAMHHLDDLRQMGRQLASVIRKIDEPVLIVASTDMSHQIPLEEARRLDGLATDRILAVDPPGLYRTVAEHRISMCGVVPVTLGLFAAMALGAKTATIVEYSTSADASGDISAVVGYAGFVVE